MENKKSFKGLLLTGSIVTGAILSTGSVKANNLFEQEDLGSGSQVRARLLESTQTSTHNLEMSCGSSTESKSTEHKCGEGKCGEKKTEAKKTTKKSKKSKKESKSGEQKCGEKKCGGGK